MPGPICTNAPLPLICCDRVVGVERLKATVPLVTMALVLAWFQPLAPPLPNCNVPAKTVTGPLKVLAPLRICVPCAVHGQSQVAGAILDDAAEGGRPGGRRQGEGDRAGDAAGHQAATAGAVSQPGNRLVQAVEVQVGAGVHNGQAVGRETAADLALRLPAE